MPGKELRWVGSSKRDLMKMPGDVIDVFGFALGEVQYGRTHPNAKPMTKGALKAKGIYEVVEDGDGSTYRCVYTVKLADIIDVLHCFQKKVEVRDQDAAGGHRFDQTAISGRAARCGSQSVRRWFMKVEIERSSGNVYADLGYPDADEMKIKAGLARAIACAIEDRGLTQTEAAKRMGLSQPKVSGLLRGRFRGISVEKMMECLQSLGLDVQITVGPAKHPEHAEILVVA